MTLNSRKMANEVTRWYFDNNIKIDPSALPFKAIAQLNPKYSDEIWATLLTEAISAFTRGLEIDQDNRKLANLEYDQKLYKAAVNLVGKDSFNVIAYLVAAAGTRKLAIDELDSAFDNIQDTSQQFKFRSPTDMTQYLRNDLDKKVYAQYSTYMVKLIDQPPTQPLAHQTAQYLQDLAKVQGLSPEFSTALGSESAYYLEQANQLAASSGGNVGQTGTGISGLPTGVSVGG